MTRKVAFQLASGAAISGEPCFREGSKESEFECGRLASVSPIFNFFN
ncbi:MAG TPA: hypothetical protein VIC00_02905 [Candidatus Acidoferrales bacterium]